MSEQFQAWTVPWSPTPWVVYPGQRSVAEDYIPDTGLATTVSPSPSQVNYQPINSFVVND